MAACARPVVILVTRALPSPGTFYWPIGRGSMKDGLVAVVVVASLVIFAVTVLALITGNVEITRLAVGALVDIVR